MMLLRPCSIDILLFENVDLLESNSLLSHKLLRGGQNLDHT